MKEIQLGTFEVTSGKLVLSDPCYELSEDSCNHTIGTGKNIANGTWRASMVVADVPTWGTRVVKLIACHESVPPKAILFQGRKIKNLGVDSGQFGIFDYASYDRGSRRGQFSDESSFYGSICALTLEHRGGVIPGGCVSRSGFGDGSYDAQVFKSPDKKTCKVVVTFIEES